MRLRPITNKEYDPEWTGPLCLKDGTPVYKDFIESTNQDIRGVFVSEELTVYGYWDAAGNSLSPNGQRLYCAEEVTL